MYKILHLAPLCFFMAINNHWSGSLLSSTSIHDFTMVHAHIYKSTKSMIAFVLLKYLL